MIDNNVVLDKLLRREPFYEDSSRVFVLYAFGEATNYISANMLTDIFYYLCKSYGCERAYEILEQGLSTMRVSGITAEDGLHCLRQRWDDFEDCLVARCAEKVKADYIVTRNTKDFTKSRVPAITPKDLLDLLETRDGLTYNEFDLIEYPRNS
jgi:predicted nucleic-acid-binding protein